MDDWGDLPGRLFVISGPSGVGKSTLARRVAAAPGLRARISVSATTRSPREGERDGVDYLFQSRVAFEEARRRGELLEWAEVHGHFYGTPAGPLRSWMARGFCPILVIDVQGGVEVRRRVPEARLVFVDPPAWDILETRLRGRGTDDEATIRRRLDNARREIEVGREHYPHHIVNDDLDRAVAEVVALMRQEGCGGPSPDAR